MKQFSCSDSLSNLLYPPEEEVNPKENYVCSREFQAMLDGLDGEDMIEESYCQSSTDKKRRLSNHQVKSLEKIFEVDNKLDPERKVKLAQDLGLQPRQVAIWFQNRRARWKTKQLERDYTHLKANYEALKLNYKKLEQEKEIIIAELVELKAKLPVERRQTNEFNNKKKDLFLGSHNNISNQSNDSPFELCGEPEPTKGLVDLKDGLSDSDSSGVLNEESSNLNGQLLISPPPRFDLSSLCSSSSSLNYTQVLDSRAFLTKSYQQQLMKMEEQCFVSSSEESSCNIFSVDQAPTLCWYFSDQRN